MNTKLLMTSSALIMGIAGITLTFLPQETAAFLGWNNPETVLIQILGALYFGFAMVNWTTKSNLLGGIYGRPLTIGNFSHYLIAAFALLKSIKSQSGEKWVIIAAIVYSIFAILFGYVMLTHPKAKTSEK